MFNGKRFRMNAPILGVLEAADKAVLTEIPKGAVVDVMSGPLEKDQRMVNVRFGQQSLSLFAIDLTTRGEEVNAAAR